MRRTLVRTNVDYTEPSVCVIYRPKKHGFHAYHESDDFVIFVCYFCFRPRERSWPSTGFSTRSAAWVCHRGAAAIPRPSEQLLVTPYLFSYSLQSACLPAWLRVNIERARYIYFTQICVFLLQPKSDA